MRAEVLCMLVAVGVVFAALLATVVTGCPEPPSPAWPQQSGAQ